MSELFENAAVRDEYERWIRHFGEDDPYLTRYTLGLIDVLKAHFLIADYFFQRGGGMGGIGPRDPNLLHSAIYRQFVAFDGEEKWITPFEKCATLVFGLVKDHPFHDANKRTALLSLLYGLHKMGRYPTSGQKEMEKLVVEIATDKLRRYRRQQDLARKAVDPEVLFIADYLKRRSRQRDSRYYTITYRELNHVLETHGFCLSNPHNNFIDVCQIVERRRGVFGFGKRITTLVRVAQIGFPGWKRQVGKGAIATVRKKTRLTPERGVDSESFYRGTEPLSSMIDQYSGPLMRLANK